MQIFKKILCPVDFSEFSALALRYAAALTEENDAQLIVYHVVPDVTRALSYLDAHCPGMMEELTVKAEARLEQFIESAVPTGIEIMQQIDVGEPADGILKFTRDSVDLIVMGTHGRSGFEKFFLGSVTNKILHKANVPVLTVCQPQHQFLHEDQPRKIRISTVVCGLDLESEPAAMVNLAFSLARLYAARLLFVHATYYGNEQHPAMLRKMDELTAPEKEVWCEAHSIVEQGEPVNILKGIVERENADLLLLGHHSRGLVGEIFLGSVVKRLINSSPCPVLVQRIPVAVPAQVVLL